MKGLCDKSSPQMESLSPNEVVGSHSTSGTKKERTGRCSSFEQFIVKHQNDLLAADEIMR